MLAEWRLYSGDRFTIYLYIKAFRLDLFYFSYPVVRLRGVYKHIQVLAYAVNIYSEVVELDPAYLQYHGLSR